MPDVKVKWLEANKTSVETRRDNVKEYNVDDCSFIVYGDSVIGMSGGGIAAIWDHSKSKRYQLPLSEREVIELFGSPDRIGDYTGE